MMTWNTSENKKKQRRGTERDPVLRLDPMFISLTLDGGPGQNISQDEEKIMLGIEVEVEKGTGMQAIKIIGEEGIIVEIG